MAERDHADEDAPLPDIESSSEQEDVGEGSSLTTDQPSEKHAARASSKPALLLENTELPRGWPTEPRRIQSSIGVVVGDIVLDILLFAASVAFLAFALTVRSYAHAETALHPHVTGALISASKFGPSVLPILFACVVGRAAHAILLWRLEQGSALGTLDVLAGSTSFTSAVTTQLRLRMLSALGLILLVVWTLSPIGGQASFRQVSIGTAMSNHTASFSYMATDGNFTRMWDNSMDETTISTQNGLFQAAVIGPETIKSSPRDLWGNIKIPLIEHYEATTAADSESWFNMNGVEPVYSSLVGIPMSGASDTSFIDYYANIEANYFNLDCVVVGSPTTEYFGWTSGKNYTAANSYYFASGDGADMWLNDSPARRMEVDRRELKPANFTYWSWGPPYMANCTIITTYVEAGVSCPTTSTCGVSRLRRSQLQNPPPAYTLLDLPVHVGNKSIANWQYFATGFVSSTTGHEVTPTFTQWYLVDPNNPLSPGSGDTNFTETVPNDVYSVRLGQLMNGYWNIVNGMNVITAGITAEYTFSGDKEPPSPESIRLTHRATVSGTRSTKTTIIECHKGWVVALSITSVVMIIASLINPIVVYLLNRAPDLMLNISSLATRNNPYIPLPANGTYMSASDRARLLKSVKVRFGDVEPTDAAGNLAIASCEGTTIPGVIRVRKGRLYK